MIVNKENERERLIHPLALFTIVTVLAVVLYLLFPQKAVFEDRLYLEKPDAVSIAYLQVLLQSSPGNSELRLILVHQLTKLGRIKEARVLIIPLLENYSLSDDQSDASMAINTYQEYLQLLIVELQMASEKNLPQAKLTLAAASVNILKYDWSLQEKISLFELVKPHLSELTKVKIIVDLLGVISPENQKYQLQLRYDLAGAYSETGRVDEALDIFSEIFKVDSSPELKKEIALSWIRAALASSQVYSANLATKDIIAEFPIDIELLKLAENIALQSNDPHAAARWLEKRWKILQQPELLDSLFDLRIAAGDLKAASQLAEIIQKRATITEIQRRKLARLYTWIGKNRAALKQWLLVEENNPDQEARGAIYNLQTSLNQYQAIANRLQQRREKQAGLSLQEYQKLIELKARLGQIEAQNSVYQEAIIHYPSTRSLYVDYYSSLLEQSRYEEASGLFHKFRQLFKPQAKELVSAANILWRTRQAESALALLQIASPLAKDNDQDVLEYWITRIDLAVFVDDINDALYSYAELEKRPLKKLIRSTASDGLQERLSDVLQRFISALLYREDYKIAQRLAESGYLYLSDDGLLQNALIYAVGANDAQSIVRLLKQIDTKKNSLKTADFWAAKAQLHYEKNESEEAIVAWQKAMELAPLQPAYRNAWLWQLISSYDQSASRLEQALNNPKNFFALDQQAYGRLMLGDFSGALVWFKRGLPERQTSWQWLSAMASALDQAGQRDTAYKLRKKVLSLMAEKLEINDVTAEKIALKEQFLRLYGQLQNPVYASLIGTEELKYNLQQDASSIDANKAIEQWLVFALEGAMADNQEFLIDQYQQLALAKEIELPGWQQLSLGLQRNELELIANTLEKFNKLPSSDKTTALYRLGYQSEAMAYALEAISSELDDTTLRQQRRIAASLRPNHEHGFRLMSEQFSIGNIDTNKYQGVIAYTTDIYRRAVNLEFEADFYQFQHQAGANEAQLNDDLSSQVDISAQFNTQLPSPWLRDSSLTAKLTLYNRDQQLTTGIEARYQFSPAEFLSASIDTKWQARSALSSTIYVAGYNNNLALNLSYSLDSRTSFSSVLAWDEFVSEDKERLGQGMNYQLSGSYRVFLEDPSWTLRMNHQGLNYSRNDNTDKLLSDYFVLSPSRQQLPQNDTLLPESYQRTGVGVTLYHGELHRIARTVPAPRFILAADAGYEWQRNSFDFGMQLGVGWRVIGDDELALSTLWSSDTISGESRTTLSLSYINSFGR